MVVGGEGQVSGGGWRGGARVACGGGRSEMGGGTSGW